VERRLQRDENIAQDVQSVLAGYQIFLKNKFTRDPVNDELVRAINNDSL
jgi:hypothetical protein